MTTSLNSTLSAPSVHSVTPHAVRRRALRCLLSHRALSGTALAVLIASALTMPIAATAQSTPYVTFTSTSTALDGSLTYCGALWNFLGLAGNCPIVAITPANQDTEGPSGSDDEVASNLNVYAGNALVATIGSSDDSATDSDTGNNPSGDPAENQQSVSIFNGAITYSRVQASDDCVASPPSGSTIPVVCTVQGAITNLEIQGVRVYPAGTQVLNGTQVPLTNIPITVNGVALVLNGTLTIGAEPVTQTATNGSWGYRPIQITGQACPLGGLGCLLGYVNVQINDDLEPYGYKSDDYYNNSWNASYAGPPMNLY